FLPSYRSTLDFGIIYSRNLAPCSIMTMLSRYSAIALPHRLESLDLTIFLAVVISCQSKEFIILQFPSAMIYLRSSTDTNKISEEDNSVGQNKLTIMLSIFNKRLL